MAQPCDFQVSAPNHRPSRPARTAWAAADGGTDGSVDHGGGSSRWRETATAFDSVFTEKQRRSEEEERKVG
jgi:hypothetical protein